MNKTSARIATFAVRPCGGHVVNYTYNSRRDQKPVTAYKFEVWLVGNDAKNYCIGYLKGSRAECEQAMTKYSDNNVWSLSKVVFDAYTLSQYISTPILYRVDLAKSTMI